MEVFKDEVKEIIFRIRGEISDLSILERIAENLPERQPGIFDPDSFAQESEEPEESPSLIEETAGIPEKDVT
jgi:hypothetical protein